MNHPPQFDSFGSVGGGCVGGLPMRTQPISVPMASTAAVPVPVAGGFASSPMNVSSAPTHFGLPSGGMVASHPGGGATVGSPATALAFAAQHSHAHAPTILPQQQHQHHPMHASALHLQQQHQQPQHTVASSPLPHVHAFPASASALSTPSLDRHHSHHHAELMHMSSAGAVPVSSSVGAVSGLASSLGHHAAAAQHYLAAVAGSPPVLSSSHHTMMLSPSSIDLAADGPLGMSFSMDSGFLESQDPHATGASLQRLYERRKRRRESHNAVERRRRDHINERIAEMASLLPEAMISGDPDFKPNKGQILQKTVEYLRQMQQGLREALQHQGKLEQALQNLGVDVKPGCAAANLAWLLPSSSGAAAAAAVAIAGSGASELGMTPGVQGAGNAAGDGGSTPQATAVVTGWPEDAEQSVGLGSQQGEPMQTQVTSSSADQLMSPSVEPSSMPSAAAPTTSVGFVGGLAMMAPCNGSGAGGSVSSAWAAAASCPTSVSGFVSAANAGFDPTAARHPSLHVTPMAAQDMLSAAYMIPAPMQQ